MVLYEVTMRVREDLRGAWEAYLPAHVADIMKTGCFESGSIHRGGPGEYRVSYLASSQARLDQYLAEFATAMRADTANRFPQGLEISRAVWTEWHRLKP
jgi:hypothetical protein